MTHAAVRGLMRSLELAGNALRGRPLRRRSRDRTLLERHILPAYAGRADVRRVLFVGCASYTQHYEQLFRHAEYWTLDAVPRNRRWGARLHLRDRLERLDRHVAPDYFDLIICNGVLGWGLNRRDDAETAFAACRRALRDGGELVLGWNDVYPHNAVRPQTLVALQRYERCALHGIGGPVVRIDVPHRHVYEFYRKGGTGAEHADTSLIARDPGPNAAALHRSAIPPRAPGLGPERARAGVPPAGDARLRRSTNPSSCDAQLSVLLELAPPSR